MSAQAPAAKAASADTKAAAAPSGDFVGQDTCVTCHDEIGKKFADNPHTKMALMHGSSGVTCESCHGAGKAHVDGGGDITKIFNPAKAHGQGSGREVPELPRWQRILTSIARRMPRPT